MAKLGDEKANNRIIIDDKGIIRTIIAGHQSADSMRGLYNKLVKLTAQHRRQGKKIIVLSDITHLKMPKHDPDARLITRKIFQLPYDRVALFGNSKLLMLTMVALRAAGNHRIKAFTSKRRALKWLHAGQRETPAQPLTNLIVGIGLIGIGALALFGWQTDTQWMMETLPQRRPVNPLAALGLIILGYGLIAYWYRQLRQLQICAVIVGIFGLSALLNIGLDQILFHDKVLTYGLRAHLADSAALCFIIVGTIPFLIEKNANHVRWPIYGAASVIGLIGLYCIFGQLYAPKALDAHFAMAFNLAIAFLLVVFAVIITTLHRQQRDVLGHVSHVGWLIVLALLFMQLATYLSWNQAIGRVERDSKQAFHSQVGDTALTVTSQLQAYVNTLRGFHGLFAASEEVTRDDFTAYYKSLDIDSKSTGLRSISYLAVVNNSEIDTFVAKQRQQQPNFTIQSLSQHPRHFIGTYNATDPNSRGLGLDASVIPGRYEIYNHAITTGESYTSGTITFPQLPGQPARKGFFITIPVKTATAQSYQGLVNANFNYEDFFPTLFKKINPTNNLAIDVIDSMTKEIIYHTGPELKSAPLEGVLTIPLVGNATWDLRIRAPEGYGTGQTQRRLPRSVLFSGQLLSILLLIIFILQARGRGQAIKLAEAVTADLDEERNRIMEMHTRSEAILKGIGDGLIAVDEKGRIEMINAVAKASLGLKEEAAIGQYVAEILPAYDSTEKLIAPDKHPLTLALKTSKVVAVKLYYARTNGTIFPVQITAAPIIIAGKTIGAIEVFRDITDEVQLDKSKNEFVSLASHQLRTPLSAVNWYVEMLLNGDAGKLTKTQLEYLNEINRSNARMIELVSALLDVSRLDLGRIISQPKDTDVVQMIRDIEDEHTELIEKNHQTITKKMTPTPLIAHIDPKLLRLILQNLINNAIKYSPDSGKITLELRFATKKEVAAAKLKERKQYIFFSIHDNGIGIPQAQQSKIFNKFYRADNVQVLDVDGTGLGLYAVREISERLGGRIWFESHENKGSAFYIILPTETPAIDNGVEVK